MLILDTELTVDGRAEALWGVWTDVERWAEWDPHEEEAHIHGRFETGATGFSKPRGAPPGEFTVVEAREPLRWVTGLVCPSGPSPSNTRSTPLTIRSAAFVCGRQPRDRWAWWCASGGVARCGRTRF